MKKIIFILALLFPFIVSAADNVKITNIEQLEKSDTVTVNNEPTFEGLKINFDLKFTELNDFVKYKVTIKNEDSKDYEIEAGVSFSEGEYVKYEFGLNGEQNVIKAGEEKELTLQITYVKEPDPEHFVDGKYVEQNAMSINLSTEDGQHSSVDPAAKEDNPHTGARGIIILIAVLLGIAIVIISLEKKNAFFLIALFLLIPLTIHALEKITLDIDTKIEIEANEKTFKVIDYNCGFGEPKVYEFAYMNGMTWDEWKASDYCTQARAKYTTDEISDYAFENLFTSNNFEYNEYNACMEAIPEVHPTEGMTDEEIDALYDAAEQATTACKNNYLKPATPTSVILSKNKGFYYDNRECLT